MDSDNRCCTRVVTLHDCPLNILILLLNDSTTRMLLSKFHYGASSINLLITRCIVLPTELRGWAINARTIGNDFSRIVNESSVSFTDSPFVLYCVCLIGNSKPLLLAKRYDKSQLCKLSIQIPLMHLGSRVALYTFNILIFNDSMIQICLLKFTLVHC